MRVKMKRTVGMIEDDGKRGKSWHVNGGAVICSAKLEPFPPSLHKLTSKGILSCKRDTTSSISLASLQGREDEARIFRNCGNR